MSNPPHRDFPIEWRTETGEFISQPVPGQPAEGAPAGPSYGQPVESPGQPQPGPAPWGQPSPVQQPPVQQPPAQPPPWGQALPGQHIGPPPAPPQSRDEPLSADDLLGVRVAAPDEHRAATRLQMAVLALVLIGLSLTWAMGGLEKVPGYLPDDGIRTVAVGEQVDTGPFRITVEQAAVFTEYGDQRAYEDGGTILIVTVTVENLGNETAYIGSTALGNTAIALDGVRGVKAPDPNQVVSMRDGSTLSQVQPGLPERVGYVWELNAGAEPPQEIGVLLYGATWRRSSFIHLNPIPTWWERGPRARTTVTVQDRRGDS